MATFEVKVYRLNIEPHPNADSLELGRIGDYLSAVQKEKFKTGDLVAYIPEQAVLPNSLIEEMGLTGKLAGKQKNRVKPIKLRGILSQGLIYPAKSEWKENQDVTEELNIVKYEPPVPVHLQGEVYNAGTDVTLKYDIENFKKYPHIFNENHLVCFTEKIHGTFMLFVELPRRMYDEKHYQGKFIVSSKGLAAQGLGLKHNEKNMYNLYLRTAKKYDLYNKFDNVTDTHNDPIFVLGEVFGKGVQDLNYGINRSDNIELRIFDIRIGRRWMNPLDLNYFCKLRGLDTVPILYKGLYTKQLMEEYTNGKETISGKECHIREGIVIRPLVERNDSDLGRVILKNVSENYLLRKGNTTEFQ